MPSPPTRAWLDRGPAWVGDALFAASLPFWPLLVAQGLAVRLITPRLSEAAGPDRGRAGTGRPSLRVVAVGESTVAGVGAEDHDRALTGRFAAALAQRTGGAVSWHAAGRNGATAQRALRELVPRLEDERADLALVALGVNDVLRLRSPERYRTDLARLVGALRASLGDPPVLVSAVPPLERFPRLPQPLRGVLGLRARALDRAAARWGEAQARVAYVRGELGDDPHVFASDGFHPSALGYARWGEQLATAAVALLARARLPAPHSSRASRPRSTATPPSQESSKITR